VPSLSLTLTHLDAKRWNFLLMVSAKPKPDPNPPRCQAMEFPAHGKCHARAPSTNAPATAARSSHAPSTTASVPWLRRCVCSLLRGCTVRGCDAATLRHPASDVWRRVWRQYLVLVTISILFDLIQLASLPSFDNMTAGESFGATLWVVIFLLKPIIVGTIYACTPNPHPNPDPNPNLAQADHRRHATRRVCSVPPATPPAPPRSCHPVR
jgi:hypothetical protein